MTQFSGLKAYSKIICWYPQGKDFFWFDIDNCVSWKYMFLELGGWLLNYGYRVFESSNGMHQLVSIMWKINNFNEVANFNVIPWKSMKKFAFLARTHITHVAVCYNLWIPEPKWQDRNGRIKIHYFNKIIKIHLFLLVERTRCITVTPDKANMHYQILILRTVNDSHAKSYLQVFFWRLRKLTQPWVIIWNWSYSFIWILCKSNIAKKRKFSMLQ